MTFTRATGALALGASLLVTPLAAQDEDRIWADVRTTDGSVHSGFLRWDRNEGSWVDILDGTKEIPSENLLAWRAAKNVDGPPVRTVDLLGYRITWNEVDSDFPEDASSGIRFGHLRSLRVVEDAAELTLRSGEMILFDDGASDIGPGMRELSLEKPDGETIELDWSDLLRVDFSAAPPGARAQARRIYGTVTDDVGRRFTGYLSWDLDEILATDELDGDDVSNGDDRSIRFGDIATIAKLERGARVRLTDGTTVDLRGSNDVDRGHRGVQISDPNLGMVEVEWRDFGSVRFHEPDAAAGYDAFDGGRPLRGVVETRGGERLEGTIRWDADEAASWEFLNGRSEGVAFTIEFGRIARIERAEPRGSTVTLIDGRTFTLDRSNDVTGANKGILVAVDNAPDGANATADPESAATRWRVVDWDDFQSLTLTTDAATDGRRRP